MIFKKSIMSVYFLSFFIFFNPYLYPQCSYPSHVSNWSNNDNNYNYSPQWQGIVESSGSRVGTHEEPFENWEISGWHWMSYYAGNYYCCEGWSVYWYTNPFSISNNDDEGNYYFVHYGSVNTWSENMPYISTWITSKRLDLTLCDDDKISFLYKLDSDGSENNLLEIQYSIDQSEWNTIESFNEQTDGWEVVVLEIENILPQLNNIWIRMKSTAPTSINSTYFWSHTYLDDIITPPLYGANSSNPPMSFELVSPDQNQIINLGNVDGNDSLSFSFLPVDDSAEEYKMHFKGIQSIESLPSSILGSHQLSISSISNYMIVADADTMEILWDISLKKNDWELYSNNGPYILKIVNGQCPINYSWNNEAEYYYPDPSGTIGSYDGWSVFGDTQSSPFGNWQEWIIQPWSQTTINGSNNTFLSSMVEVWDNGPENNTPGGTFVRSQRIDLSRCYEDELKFDYAIISNGDDLIIQTLFIEYSYDNMNWNVLDSISAITANGSVINEDQLTNYNISLESTNIEQSDEFYIKFKSYYPADVNIEDGSFYISNILMGNVYTPPLYDGSFENDQIEPLTLLSPPHQEIINITDGSGVYSFFWNNPNNIDTLEYELVFDGDLEFIQSQTINSSLAIIQIGDVNNHMNDLGIDSITGTWRIDISNFESFTNENQNGPFEITFINENILAIENITFPNKYALHQNYPNPFNPITSLRYNLPNDGLVNIAVYDMMGKIVKTLVNSSQNAGFKSVQWNATNERNEPVSAGLYLYTIQAGEFRQTRKMVLLK